MGIDLYSMIESPPCRAVLMTAKILNISLNIKPLDLSKKEHLNDEHFVKLNPQRCVPTLNDNGFVLWESRAIIRYLVDAYAANSDLYPRDVKKRAKVDQLLDFDIGTLYRFEGLFLYPLFVGKQTNSEDEAKFRSSLNLLNSLLSDKQFVTSNTLTIADISLIASLSYAEACEFDFSQYANLVQWMKRVKQSIDCYEEINATAMHNFTEFMREKKRQVQ